MTIRKRSRAWAALVVIALLAGAGAVWQWVWPHQARVEVAGVPHTDLQAAGYVNSQVCVECHADAAEGYSHTGMARTFHRPTKQTVIEDFQRANRFVHKTTGLTYTMLERDGRFYQRRSTVGYDGKESNVLEAQIDYVIGSGNHGRAYLHRTEQGKLVQLPISWYVEKGGYWNMSPGLDRSDQPDMHGTVAADCIFCHTAYPLTTSSKAPDDEQVFPEALPEGIDCQRCHGPGAAHVSAARAKRGEDEIRKSVVNPERLDRDRQLEVCMQCHLETSAHHVPNSIRNYAKDINSFRPGQAMGEYKIYFERPKQASAPDFEMAHASYQLPRSACFQKSTMTCLTCHDPHNIPRGVEAKQHYIEVCQGCHASTKNLASDAGHKKVVLKPGSDCLSCHVPKRRPEGSVHIVLTDHRIPRFLPPGDLSAPIPERVPVLDHTKVDIYYPTKEKPKNADLYLAVAQVDDAGVDGIGQLRAVLDREQPKWPEPYVALGQAYAEKGQTEQALKSFQQALSRRPEDRDALDGMANVLLTANRLDDAIGILERGVKRYPNDDHFLANLGTAYLREGKLQEAEDTLWKTLVVNPEHAQVRNLLGVCALQRHDAVHAEENFREAIRLEPLLPEPHKNLATLLTGKHELKEAEFEFRRAIALNPKYADAHHGLGLVLVFVNDSAGAAEELSKAAELAPTDAQILVDLADVRNAQGRAQDAEDAYTRALTINPAHADANLSLGMLLLKQGRTEAAVPHLLKAAQGADPDVAQRAQQVLASVQR